VTTEEKLKAATLEAMAEAEAIRNASDKVVSLTPSPDGIVALTASGRMFLRATDPNHYNDGRTTRKFRWTLVEGPLGA
jgi:hypothetical protein